MAKEVDVIKEMAESLGESPAKSRERLEYLDTQIRRGEVRTKITCSEARIEFMAMTWNLYVYNGPPRFPIDAEVGMHVETCNEPKCGILKNAYFNTLKGSDPDDIQGISDFLSSLEAQVLT